MTTRNASETKTRRRFIENDCRLEFQQGIEPGKWPEHHKVTFQHIEELGSTHFGEWKAEIQADWRKYPWRLDTRRRAEEIVEKTKQCQRERKNEREWRSEIEPLVFTRLAKDVSCRWCGFRLWRADVEAVVNAKEEFAALLDHSKKSRRRCECPTEGLDAGEPGLSSMFTYREEEIVKHDLAAAAKLKKKSEKPDRVYGLRQTGTLLKLLRTKVGDDEFGTLEERLEPTLFPNDLKPQVFPFLLLEAKTGSSASFQEIDDQSGVMLHKCLTIQQRLRDAISPASKWIAGPLCWYISSCGATWRIAAGYAVDSSRIDFEVANLWVGYIDKDDGALQLLLIADYICDWARSVHREAMIRSLNKLATCPSPELNDLASLRSFDRLTVNSYHGKRDLDILETFAENASESNLLKKLEKISSWESGGVTTPLEDPFGQFDSQFGVVRDAGRIHTRFMGLYITLTNLPLLIHCTNSERESKMILSKILKSLDTEEPLTMDQSSLVDLEKAWTGHSRIIHEHDDSFHKGSEEEFHVLMTFSSFINSEWELTRELCILAITKPAKELLLKRTRKYNNTPAPANGPITSPDAIAEILRRHRQCSVPQLLSACLYRSSTCARIRSKSQTASNETYEDSIYEDAEHYYLVNHREGDGSREIVWSLYLHHRVGRNEPFTPILWVSSRLDQQNVLSSECHGSSSPWSTYNIGSEEVAVLARCLPAKGSSLAAKSTVCIYVVDKAQTPKILPLILIQKWSFNYCFVTQKVALKDGQTIRWNMTHDIRKRAPAREGATIVTHMEDKLLYDELTNSEEPSNDEEGEFDDNDDDDDDYEPDSSQGSDGDSSENSIEFNVTEPSGDEIEFEINEEDETSEEDEASDEE